MERKSVWFVAVLVGVVALCLPASPARGQEPRVLYGDTNSTSWVSQPIRGALGDLGLDFTLVFSSEDFLDELRFGRWDLVIFRSKQRFVERFEFEIIAELEAHVADGGALHFQMADLDNAPQRLLDLLGLEGAVDLELPLHELELEPPQHPSVAGGGFLTLWDEAFPPDFGDALIAGDGALVTQHYFMDGRPATVLSHSGRVIVNGPQWDNWAPGSSSALIAGQIRWLLRCTPDLDLDGQLTIADFLLFQNMFDWGDPSADFDADGRLTIFDFLEFFNEFEVGCR